MQLVVNYSDNFNNIADEFRKWGWISGDKDRGYWWLPAGKVAMFDILPTPTRRNESLQYGNDDDRDDQNDHSRSAA